MAAAVAYRTIFALAPLLILAVAIFGFVVGGSEEAQQALVDAIDRIAGTEVAEAIEVLVVSTVTSSDVTAIVGLVLFAWTGSSLFFELQNNLNDIFGVPYRATAGFKGFVLRRGVALIWVLGLGFLLVAIWLVNLGWSWLESLLPESMEGARGLLGIGARLLSLAILPLVFTLVFRTLTRAPVRWRAILLGSVFTSVVFMVTAWGAGLYFTWDSGSGATQIAGSVFVILLLAYVLSAVFLFGAEVTRVFNDHLAGPARS
jgi:membrane protein